MIIGLPWWLFSTLSFIVTNKATNDQLLIIYVVPLLIIFSFYLNWSNIRNSKEIIKKEASKYLGKNNTDVVADAQRQGFCFTKNNNVLLISMRKGERYVEEIDIDDCAWIAIRNSSGSYLGIEIVPPAGKRPRAGSLKIRVRSTSLSANTLADYKFHGIPSS